MATVTVTFCSAGNRTFEGASLGVARLPASRSEVLTSGATSVATETVSFAVIENGHAGVNRDGGFVSITAVGGNVWVTSGPEPVAAVPDGEVGEGFPVLDGQTREFAISKGDKIAVIDWVL